MKTTDSERQLDAPTIGELVANDYRKAAIFKKFGIDFCCGGKKTVAKACSEKGLDAAIVEQELKESELKPVESAHNFSEWEPGFLADYIVSTHHRYVAKTMPLIDEYTQKVARVHGKSNPETIEIAELFTQVMTGLSHHMIKEEEILFPYIKALSDAGADGHLVKRFASVLQPIHVMEEEHEEAGKIFERIKNLSGNYTPPENACATFRVAYASLKEFEADLHEHIHLENNILFPAAVRLENERMSG